jgi:acyl-CoA synthetase (AMP-forming)/AMP-acid ligase II/acyl carrier protein
MMQAAAVTFDAATFEIWGSLLNGGKLVLGGEHAPTLEEVAEAIELHNINTMFMTTSLFHQMVDHYPSQLTQVEQLMTGGEVISPAHVERFLAEPGGHGFSNFYGPTENTSFTTYCKLASPASIATSVPIGRPIANTRVYVLDPHLKPCPVGAPGELFIAGDGLARGYVNRPDLTADKFIPDPYSKRGGERLYRSGDIVRYLAGGELEFMGRADRQVKIRGFRIEIGEVEAALGECEGVGQCAVISESDGRGEKRLVGYVTREGEGASVGEIKGRLKERIPEYMMPWVIVMMEEMPLNANGKIDRSALPAPDSLRTELYEMFVSPRTPIERVLADIWTEVLQVKQVGVFDNFFDLGGHSLLATRIISRVRDACQVKLPMTSFFEAPTVAQLAEVVDMKFFEQLTDLPEEDASRFA